MQTTFAPGKLLRDWRIRRRRSQLDLSLDVGVSTRHLSFLETGRAQPSRDMVLRLARELDIPLREQNELLLAAGFAPAYGAHALTDRALEPLRASIEAVLRGHEPFPALAIDSHWMLLFANRALAPLLRECDPGLLAAPVNVLRLTLHPEGLARRIDNLAQWREHLLDRLERQIARAPDPALSALLRELMGYPVPSRPGPGHAPPDGIAVPLRLWSEGGLLSFIGTTMVFGTPLDVTLAELAIETFLPADAQTAAFLRDMLPGT